MKLITNILVIAFLLKSVLLSSQTCDSAHAYNCGLNDLSPAGILLGHEHPKGIWKLSYRYMSTMMNGATSGTKKVDDDFVFNNYSMSPQSMRMNMHMVMAMYGITDKLSLMAMFNYSVSSMKMNMPPDTMQMQSSMTSDNGMSSKSMGLGDTKVYAMYSLINQNAHHLLLNAGFSLPTGSIQMKGGSNDPMYPLQRFSYMMQMGSGTIDFMPGVTYLLKKNKATFSTQFTSVLRPFTNSLNYRLGNEYVVNVWGGYQWFPWLSSSLRIEGTSAGTIVGKDASLFVGTEPSANAMNYGGENVKSFLGLNFYINKGWLKNNKVSVEYGMPLYQNLYGIQLAQTSSLYVGWLISF
jgi:hypothetical protein